MNEAYLFSILFEISRKGVVIGAIQLSEDAFSGSRVQSRVKEDFLNLPSNLVPAR